MKFNEISNNGKTRLLPLIEQMKSGAFVPLPRVMSPFRGGGGLRTSMTRITMLAGVFILLLGPPKPDRLKDRGQTK